MKTEEISTDDRRPADRVPLDRPVSLEFSHFRDFIEAVTDNISESGMFIRTTDVRGVGSEFHFKLTLADGHTLIDGTGEVVWLSVQEKESGRSTGMGVRFLSLVRESAELVRNIVAEHRRVGHAAFDLDVEKDPPELSPNDFVSFGGGLLPKKAIVVQQREIGLIEVVYLDDKGASIAEDMKWVDGSWGFVKSSPGGTYAADSSRLAPFALRLRAELEHLP